MLKFQFTMWITSRFNLMGTEGNVIATARKNTGSESWYLYNKDTRGSTTSLVNGSGQVAAAYEYDDFGSTNIRAGADFDNEICYTGQIYDKNTGLYYYNAFLLGALATQAKRTA